MVCVNKFKAKLVEKGINMETLAKELGVNAATIYRRLADNGDSFTVGEVDKIGKFLGLTKDEMNAIFFAQYVA